MATFQTDGSNFVEYSTTTFVMGLLLDGPRIHVKLTFQVLMLIWLMRTLKGGEGGPVVSSSKSGLDFVVWQTN